MTAQVPDTKPGDYFVSAIDGERLALVSGPYPTHQAALDDVEVCRAKAEETDPRAHFYAFGTVRTKPSSGRVGFLQMIGAHPPPVMTPALVH